VRSIFWIPSIRLRRSRISRAVSRISAIEKPSLQSAMVAIDVSPKVSFTMGPMVPSGRLDSTSPIRLRNSFQTWGRSSEGTSSLMVTWRIHSPTLEVESLISSTSPMDFIFSSMGRVISRSTFSTGIPGFFATTNASRMVMYGSSSFGIFPNRIMPPKNIPSIITITVRELLSAKSVILFIFYSEFKNLTQRLTL